MGKWLVVCLVIASTAAQAQPASAPPQQQLVRISLHDGRTVDGYITGGDVASVYVQTSAGYFSIVRTNVVAITPLASAPPPLPGQIAPVPPVDEARGPTTVRLPGLVYFGTSYLITVIAASAKQDEDSTAKLGFIPVAGPVLWAFSKDEDGVGEDGWDWLAVGGSVMQLGGIYWMLEGHTTKTSRIAVTPVTSRQFAGVAIAGGW